MKRGLSVIPTTIVKGWRCLPRWDRWFAIPFMFVFFALVGWVPELYVRATEIPPFEELQRTSGIISFERAGRAGWGVKLNTDHGILAFSCWTGGRNKDCVHETQGHKIKELQNLPATVWWFPRPNPYTQDQFAAQIEIDGVIVQSYQESVERLSIAKSDIPAFMAFFIIFPFVYLGLRMRSCLKKGVIPK